MRKVLAGLAAIALLAGCSAAEETDSPEPTKKTSAAAPHVPWKDYAPLVQERIDRFAEKGACGKLQREFDTADANNETTMSRTGHNNADLMDYIDFKMREADCY